MSEIPLNPEIINALSNLSLGVIAILALAGSLFVTARNNSRLAKSVNKLAIAIEKKEALDKNNANVVKRSMEENTKVTQEAAEMIQNHTEIIKVLIKKFQKPTHNHKSI